MVHTERRDSNAVRLQERLQRILYAAEKACDRYSSAYELYSSPWRGRPEYGGRRVQAFYRTALRCCIYDKNEQKSTHHIDGYFDYVVPPLEGLWRQDGVNGIDYAHKEKFRWISLIRLPDFVTEADVEWAKDEASRKKKADFSKVEFLTYDEGMCIQCMHIGSYDDEPATVRLMHEYMEHQGYTLDISDSRLHHEIYLSDARRVTSDKLKTVIRHPVKLRQHRTKPA